MYVNHRLKTLESSGSRNTNHQILCTMYLIGLVLVCSDEYLRFNNDQKELMPAAFRLVVGLGSYQFSQLKTPKG